MSSTERRRTAKAPAATAVIAAGLAAATFAPHHLATQTVADSKTYVEVPATPLAPFAASARGVPLVVASTPSADGNQPAASAPITTLPRDLNVNATEIPRVVLAAFVNAAQLADKSFPTCHVTWQTIGGIGFIESDDARAGGSFNPGWDGEANPPILGPLLDGSDGFPAVPDTDDGKLDGNTQWDRAVGPMQFLPSTWAEYAADGNHDGILDPEQIDDATLATADYLCTNGGDLSKLHNLHKAIYAYNHSWAYVRDVLTVSARYLGVNPKSLGVDAGHLDLPKGKKRHLKPAGKGRPPVLASPTTSSSPSTSPTTSGGSPRPTPSTSASPSPTTTAGSGSPSTSPTASPTPSPTASTGQPTNGTSTAPQPSGS